MGWRDRDYNRGAEAAREFFSNPASAFGFGIPLGRWFGARVTLHFWMLLTFLFIFVDGIQAQHSLASPAVACVLLFATALLHEYGQKFFASLFGGHHEEFVLWPFGGMQAPAAPPEALPLLGCNIGGIVVNIFLTIIFGISYFSLAHDAPLPVLLNPLNWIEFAFAFPNALVLSLAPGEVTISLLRQLFIYNLGMLIVNLLPYYWFDGGHIWQAVCWPMLRLYRAINVVCIAGMILAVPMFFMTLFDRDLFGMILWVLLFSSSYVRRQTLKQGGPADLQGDFAYSSAYAESGRSKPHGRRTKSWFRTASKKAARDRAEQKKIDAILAKVHDKGLHSLSWGEKRTLRRATERQRQQDLAGRL